METVRTIPELRAQVGAWRAGGLTTALVPTMGALHEGHLSLARRGLELADRVVASVFVNPTQFGPNEDFGRYPRQEAQDSQMLAGAGCHLLYLPTVAGMYPQGAATTITVAGLSKGLCGDVRPGHFQGVATVVAKLLLQCLPDIALFGEKDWQQLAVIRRMVEDLDIPVAIHGVPTLREPDGLAMSSRNAYLSPEERRIAPAIHRAMTRMAEDLRAGAEADSLCRAAAARLLAAGFLSVDYVAVCDARTLAPLTRLDRPARILVAARLGGARLIDNLGVAAG